MAIFGWPSGWDPVAGLRAVQREMERLMGRFGENRRVGGGNYPAVNVLDGPNEMVVQAEMAGVKRQDIDLSITGETLVIKGVKHAPPDEQKLRYHRRERGTGEFDRTVVLPDKVDAARIEASFTNGILTVRLPKSEAARPKQIAVK